MRSFNQTKFKTGFQMIFFTCALGTWEPFFPVSLMQDLKNISSRLDLYKICER